MIFLDGLVKLAQGHVTVRDEFEEVIFEDEDETEIVIDEFLWWRGYTEKEWGDYDAPPDMLNSHEPSED